VTAYGGRIELRLLEGPGEVAARYPVVTPGGPASIQHCAVSDDGEVVVATSRDALFREHRGTVSCVAQGGGDFGPIAHAHRGTRIAVDHASGIEVRDPILGTVKRVQPKDAFESPLDLLLSYPFVTFDAEDRRVLLLRPKADGFEWDLSRNEVRRLAFGKVTRMAVSPQGWIAVAADDWVYRVIGASREGIYGASDRVTSLTFSEKGDRLAIGCADGSVHVIDPR
jgi:hypothetical protein